MWHCWIWTFPTSMFWWDAGQRGKDAHAFDSLISRSNVFQFWWSVWVVLFLWRVHTAWLGFVSGDAAKGQALWPTWCFSPELAHSVLCSETNLNVFDMVFKECKQLVWWLVSKIFSLSLSLWFLFWWPRKHFSESCGLESDLLFSNEIDPKARDWCLRQGSCFLAATCFLCLPVATIEARWWNGVFHFFGGVFYEQNTSWIINIT